MIASIFFWMAAVLLLLLLALTAYFGRTRRISYHRLSAKSVVIFGTIVTLALPLIVEPFFRSAVLRKAPALLFYVHLSCDLLFFILALVLFFGITGEEKKNKVIHHVLGWSCIGSGAIAAVLGIVLSSIMFR